MYPLFRYFYFWFISWADLMHLVVFIYLFCSWLYISFSLKIYPVLISEQVDSKCMYSLHFHFHMTVMIIVRVMCTLNFCSDVHESKAFSMYVSLLVSWLCRRVFTQAWGAQRHTYDTNTVQALFLCDVTIELGWNRVLKDGHV